MTDPTTDRHREAREALDALRRSVNGRCINVNCPSQHKGWGQDCIEAALEVAERTTLAALPDSGERSGLDVERLTKALSGAHVGPYRAEDMPPPDEWYRQYAESIAAEYDRLA